jgi:hypothetical protein
MRWRSSSGSLLPDSKLVGGEADVVCRRGMHPRSRNDGGPQEDPVTGSRKGIRLRDSRLRSTVLRLPSAARSIRRVTEPTGVNWLSMSNEDFAQKLGDAYSDRGNLPRLEAMAHVRAALHAERNATAQRHDGRRV